MVSKGGWQSRIIIKKITLRLCVRKPVLKELPGWSPSIRFGPTNKHSGHTYLETEIRCTSKHQSDSAPLTGSPVTHTKQRSVRTNRHQSDSAPLTGSPVTHTSKQRSARTNRHHSDSAPLRHSLNAYLETRLTGSPVMHTSKQRSVRTNRHQSDPVPKTSSLVHIPRNRDLYPPTGIHPILPH